MKTKILFMLAVFLLFRASFVYALDWRALHERADQVNLAEAEDAVRKNPASIDDLYTLGLVCLNTHEDSQAEAAFNRVLGLDPQAAEAQWGKAEVLRRKHDIEKSEVILKGIIKSRPDFSPSYISLAYIRYTRMDFDQAVNLAVQVTDQGRENVDSSNYVRAILIFSGAKGMIAHYGGPISKIINGTAVFPALKRAEKLKPNDPGVLFGMGSFYLLAPGLAGGDINKAKDYLERAIKADPQFSDAYVRLAQFYQLQADQAKFMLYLNKALEIDPRNDLALDIKNNTCKLICVQQ